MLYGIRISLAKPKNCEPITTLDRPTERNTLIGRRDFANAVASGEKWQHLRNSNPTQPSIGPEKMYSEWVVSWTTCTCPSWTRHERNHLTPSRLSTSCVSFVYRIPGLNCFRLPRLKSHAIARLCACRLGSCPARRASRRRFKRSTSAFQQKRKYTIHARSPNMERRSLKERYYQSLPRTETPAMADMPTRPTHLWVISPTKYSLTTACLEGCHLTLQKIKHPHVNSHQLKVSSLPRLPRIQKPNEGKTSGCACCSMINCCSCASQGQLERWDNIPCIQRDVRKRYTSWKRRYVDGTQKTNGQNCNKKNLQSHVSRRVDQDWSDPGSTSRVGTVSLSVNVGRWDPNHRSKHPEHTMKKNQQTSGLTRIPTDSCANPKEWEQVGIWIKRVDDPSWAKMGRDHLALIWQE